MYFVPANYSRPPLASIKPARTRAVAQILLAGLNQLLDYSVIDSRVLSGWRVRWSRRASGCGPRDEKALSIGENFSLRNSDKDPQGQELDQRQIFVFPIKRATLLFSVSSRPRQLCSFNRDRLACPLGECTPRIYLIIKMSEEAPVRMQPVAQKVVETTGEIVCHAMHTTCSLDNQLLLILLYKSGSLMIAALSSNFCDQCQFSLCNRGEQIKRRRKHLRRNLDSLSVASKISHA